MAALRREAPLWLRVANFFDRPLQVLRLLEPPQLVVWKLEFWGTQTPFDRVPASAGIDPARYAEELLSLGHYVVPYTFNTWNRQRLLEMVAPLRQRAPALLPIAQKPAVPSPGRTATRRSFGVGPGETLVGVGGLLHPAKGIEEVVEGFLATYPDPGARLLCSLVVEDGDQDAQRVWRCWADKFGQAAMRRVHVRTGPYGDWRWMCSFYRAIDVLLVNSVSDSWGRMVSEALGFGVPTVVRRADCATNHVAPDVVLVDDLADMSGPRFAAAAAEARARAPRLAAYVQQHYAVSVVRDRLLALLRAHTPRHLRPALARAAGDVQMRTALEELVVY